MYNQKRTSLLYRHSLNLVLIIGFSIIIILGVIIVSVEKNSPQSNIKTITDGIWWALTTITAVGYGDRYPVTTIGRMIAVIVMFTGITLFSLIIANIASYFVEQDEEKKQVEIESKINSLEKKIDKLLKNKAS